MALELLRCLMRLAIASGKSRMVTGKKEGQKFGRVTVKTEKLPSGETLIKGEYTVMKPKVEIKIVPVTEDDFPVVADFYLKFFFPEEPLNSSLGRIPDGNDMPFLDILKEGLSFKAINALEQSQDNVMGMVVNKEVSLSKMTDLNTIQCPKRVKIYKFLRYLDEKSKIWEIVNNENHFNILAVAVDKRYRGLKIGQRLVEESLKLARARNFKFASIECSSFYSGRFALEMGFELIGEIRYDEYLDENKEPVFKVSPPHEAIKKLIRRL